MYKDTSHFRLIPKEAKLKQVIDIKEATHEKAVLQHKDDLLGFQLKPQYSCQEWKVV